MRRNDAHGFCLNRAEWAIRRVTKNSGGSDAVAIDTLRLLPVGQAAPDFTLFSTPDQTLSLSELRGRPVVLVFYPADWSPVCGDQIGLYNELLEEFGQYE